MKDTLLTSIFLASVILASNAMNLPSKCMTMKTNSCFGINLDYNSTSLPSIVQSKNVTEARTRLELWKELKFVPTCWQTLEQFLCHVYLPKCINGSVRLPCKARCLQARTSCAMIPRFNDGKWPMVLNCEYFPTTACQDSTKTKSRSNQSTQCYHPLLKTKYKKNWFGGIQHCGLKCQNQLYTKEEHKKVHIFIAVLGFFSMFCNLFSVVTFIIDWKAQNKYPAKIIFFMNTSFCVSSFGWLLQFLGETRSKIACREDGTKRIGEPGSESGNGWCLFSFLLIYYFAFAGILWFVMLSYAWHSSFRTLGSTKDKLAGKKTYFHVLAWMIPVIATITVLILEEVDGDTLFGICFVGSRNPSMRRGFVLIPFGTCLMIGGVFMIRGTMILYKVKGQNLNFLNGRASTKIKETIIRIGLFSFMSVSFFIIVLVCHVQESKQMKLWEQSLLKYVRCEASKIISMSSTNMKCTLTNKPNIAFVHLQIFSVFGAGITVSTWSWTKATLRTWKKAWTRFRGFDVKKRIQHSLNARRNRRKINPLVQQALPAVAMAVPCAPKAAKRGSIISIASSKQSTKLRLSSFVSGFADEILSKFRPGSVANKRADIELRQSPILIRPPDGRRRSLLSIESIITTSSQGKLRLRRGSLQTSAASGSEFGMAFGHMWSVQPQLHVPINNHEHREAKNLRVIRLGEDLTKQETDDVNAQKGGTSKGVSKGGKGKKKRKSRNANKIEPFTASGSQSLGFENSTNARLPPLKNELRQRSPGRVSDVSPYHSNQAVWDSHSNQDDEKDQDGGRQSRENYSNQATYDSTIMPLKFFHETIIRPTRYKRTSNRD